MKGKGLKGGEGLQNPLKEKFHRENMSTELWKGGSKATRGGEEKRIRAAASVLLRE